MGLFKKSAGKTEEAKAVEVREASLEVKSGSAGQADSNDREEIKNVAVSDEETAEADSVSVSVTVEEADAHVEQALLVEETVVNANDDSQPADWNIHGDSDLHIIDHPLVQHKLTKMRDKDTGAKDFRELLNEISMLVGYEVTRDLPLRECEIETPLVKMTGKAIDGKKLAIVPILRAGLGMVDGLLSLVPTAKVGHIGLYRDPETHKPVEYYCKLPDDIQNRLVIITDPMLATGGSATDAVRMLKEKGCTDIRLMCLVAAPEGVKMIHEEHPGLPIFTAALDECLNEKAYILPGLGDAGDRIFGTY